jgi:hypothetical protein
LEREVWLRLEEISVLDPVTMEKDSGGGVTLRVVKLRSLTEMAVSARRRLPTHPPPLPVLEGVTLGAAIE